MLLMESLIEELPEQSQGACGSEDGSTEGRGCCLGGREKLGTVICLRMDGD